MSKKISELPEATSVASEDLMVVVQGGDTKKAAASLFLNADTPAIGPAGAVQFNNAGLLGGSATLIYDPADGYYGECLKFQSDEYSSITYISDDFPPTINEESYTSFNSTATGVGNPGGGPLIWLMRGRGTWEASEDVVAEDGLGQISFGGACQSGTRFEAAVKIEAQVKDVGTNVAANLVFGTKPSNTANPIYRMRIDADGGVVLRSTWNADPTGGSKGAGTINATGLYVSGVQIGIPPCAVSALPAAATAGVGARGFVTDSNATMTAGIGATVAGGGSNQVPVYSDGTNWKIG